MQKKIKAFIGPVIIIAYVATIIACATTPHTRTTPTKPGFYGITSYWNAGTGDIDGDVGYRLYINGPRARCITCTNCAPGTWSGNSSVISGNFPPGLSFASDGTSKIEGIPTERGNWIVKLKMQ